MTENPSPSEAKIEKPRPYWHLDAKWICGLLLTFFLSLTLFTYSLVLITSEKVAVPAMTLGVALMFSRDGIDNEREILEFKEKLKNLLRKK